MVQRPHMRPVSGRMAKSGPLPVLLKADGKPANNLVQLIEDMSEVTRRGMCAMEELQREATGYRGLMEEIRTLLVSRGYDLAELPDFLMPMALASIVPPRPLGDTVPVIHET